MKTTIQEEISDLIIKEPIENYVLTDVTNLFFEFIKWKDKNVGNPNKAGKYLYWEDHLTLEELCDYWVTYIKDK